MANSQDANEPGGGEEKTSEGTAESQPVQDAPDTQLGGDSGAGDADRAGAAAPAGTPIRTVLLMGPTDAGKSFLLANLTGNPDAIQGFEYPGIIKPIQGRDGLDDYDKLQDSNWGKNGPPPNYEDKEPKTFIFEVTAPRGFPPVQPEKAPSGAAQPGAAPPKPAANKIELIVKDTAGAHSLSKPGGTNDQAKAFHEQYWQELNQADAAIVVLPAPCLTKPTGTDDRQQIDEQAAKIMCLADALRANPKLHVIVAISKFERLFFQFGRDAFLLASNSKCARAALQKVIRSNVALMQLYRGAYDVAARFTFIPVSVYGFVKEFGHPNVTPWTGRFPSDPADRSPPAPDANNPRLTSNDYQSFQSNLANESRFGWLDDGSAVELRLRHLWRPFCNKDPFLVAAFPGLEKMSKLAFTWQDLVECSKRAAVEPSTRHRSWSGGFKWKWPDWRSILKRILDRPAAFL